MTQDPSPDSLVYRYLDLGLAVGRHLEGFVDAYYGPPELAARVTAEPVRSPARLIAQARSLLADLDAGLPLDGDLVSSSDNGVSGSQRRRWLRAQVRGVLTSARRFDGDSIAYVDEVEDCYGVRPSVVPDEVFAAAHTRIDEALPGSGSLADRLISWRESHQVPVDLLPAAVASLAEDLRERTACLLGLPEGEQVDFELVQGQPWSGFNTYLGGLRSRVAINTDLPVLSTSLPHLVAHEAYPGHHTEHCHKEMRLVRRMNFAEETIFLVGTPQCLMAEGLADLGLEVIMGRRHEFQVEAHFRQLGIRYDAEVAAEVAEAGEALGAVRGNAAWRLHAQGIDPEIVIDEVAHWGLLPRPRAQKAVEFLMHPTWRAYISCYVLGLPLCRRFVDGDSNRFARLIDEQLTPAEMGTLPAA